MVNTIELGNSSRISLSSNPNAKYPTTKAPMNPRMPMLIGNRVAITNIATNAMSGRISMEVMGVFQVAGYGLGYIRVRMSPLSHY